MKQDNIAVSKPAIAKHIKKKSPEVSSKIRQSKQTSDHISQMFCTK